MAKDNNESIRQRIGRRFQKKDEQKTDAKRENSSDEENIIEVTPGISARVKILIFILVVVVAAVVFFAVKKYISNKEYSGYETVSSVETTGDNIADYVMFNDNVLKITKDGASYIDASGNTVWDCSYDMNMPEAIVNEQYAVVADLNGRDVYVFNKSGKVSSQSMNYDITNVDISSQGVYVVVLSGTDCNYINAYDKDSNSVYEMKTSIENSGYPLDIAISDDGQKLFTSYIRVDSTTVSNYIAAYNFGSVGQNENADRLMGGFTFEDTIFPYIDFVDNDTIVCFGDNQIVIYSMSEKPSEKAVIDIGNVEMDGVFSNSEYVGYITENTEGDSKYRIYIYDINGNLEASTDYNNSFNEIYATDDELIVAGDFDCSIIYMSGNKKFSTTFGKNLMNIVPDGNRNEYIVIFENETRVIKLTEDNGED